MTSWPPDYRQHLIKRTKMIAMLAQDPVMRRATMNYYAKNPKDWINDFCVTYNPRAEKMRTMPFILFRRQEEFIDFMDGCLQDKESGLVEKARDIGATWLCVAYSVWLWRFRPGSSVGWGSRKEMLIDRMGDADSIFEKMRIIIRNLPNFMLPHGFDMRKHATYMKIINPENGATITGEAGDNIGRGGRSTIYYKDESAHYERPELIEAALGDNTDVQIDISSVNGTNNVFYKRRQAGVLWKPGEYLPQGKTRVFIFDWRDHPAKTQEWYEKRRAKAESEGLLHIFAQEVDRDYKSSVQGIIIPPQWVQAAIDAHIKLGFNDSGATVAGLDVADEGGDKNALVVVKGNIVKSAESWGEGDTGETARRAVTTCKLLGVTELYYDAIGVGAGIKSETNRLKSEGAIPRSLLIMPWMAGANPLNPQDHIIPNELHSPINEDFFENLKAQAWWNARSRFEKTYKAVTQGIKYNPDELISIPSDLPNRHQLELELSQPTLTHSKKGKLMVDKKPDGASSPNLADGFVMCYTPTKEVSILDVL